MTAAPGGGAVPDGTTGVPAGDDPDDPRGRDVVDDVRDAVLAVPGVVDLHGGAFGEVATYLPGRRVHGVRLRPDHAEVRVVLAVGSSVRDTAQAVRRAVAPWTGDLPVHVAVEDVR